MPAVKRWLTQPVNVNRIQAIRSAPFGDWWMVLDDGREFLMTRGLKEVQTRLQYAGPPAARVIRASFCSFVLCLREQ